MNPLRNAVENKKTAAPRKERRFCVASCFRPSPLGAFPGAQRRCPAVRMRFRHAFHRAFRGLLRRVFATNLAPLLQQRGTLRLSRILGHCTLPRTTSNGKKSRRTGKKQTLPPGHPAKKESPRGSLRTASPKRKYRVYFTATPLSTVYFSPRAD